MLCSCLSIVIVFCQFQNNNTVRRLGKSLWKEVDLVFLLVGGHNIEEKKVIRSMHQHRRKTCRITWMKCRPVKVWGDTTVAKKTGLSLCPISWPQKLLRDCENISFSLHKYWLWAGALIFKLEGTLEYHEEMERLIFSGMVWNYFDKIWTMESNCCYMQCPIPQCQTIMLSHHLLVRSDTADWLN
jgi:hypothetical protein